MAFKLVDVRDAALVTVAVGEVVAECGRVDLLLAFAGIVGCCHAGEMTGVQ